MRFEHCYRLDYDAHIAPSHRRVCWLEWHNSFSLGQTRDRIEYAKRRIELLDRGESAPLAMHLDDPYDAGPAAARAEPAPVPTSILAPPPAVSPAVVPSSAADVTATDAGSPKPPADDAAPDVGAAPGKSKGNQKSAPGRGRGKKTKS